VFLFDAAAPADDVVDNAKTEATSTARWFASYGVLLLSWRQPRVAERNSQCVDRRVSRGQLVTSLLILVVGSFGDFALMNVAPARTSANTGFADGSVVGGALGGAARVASIAGTSTCRYPFVCPARPHRGRKAAGGAVPPLHG
jgi:hypothetical protein